MIPCRMLEELSHFMHNTLRENFLSAGPKPVKGRHDSFLTCHLAIRKSQTHPMLQFSIRPNTKNPTSTLVTRLTCYGYATSKPGDPPNLDTYKTCLPHQCQIWSCLSHQNSHQTYIHVEFSKLRTKPPPL